MDVNNEEIQNAEEITIEPAGQNEPPPVDGEIPNNINAGNQLNESEQQVPVTETGNSEGDRNIEGEEEASTEENISPEDQQVVIAAASDAQNAQTSSEVKETEKGESKVEEGKTESEKEGIEKLPTRGDNVPRKPSLGNEGNTELKVRIDPVGSKSDSELSSACVPILPPPPKASPRPNPAAAAQIAEHQKKIEELEAQIKEAADKEYERQTLEKGFDDKFAAAFEAAGKEPGVNEGAPAHEGADGTVPVESAQNGNANESAWINDAARELFSQPPPISEAEMQE